LGIIDVVDLNNTNITLTPNTFDNTTTIDFTIQKTGSVKIVIFNLLGHEITTVFNGFIDAGKHQIRWTADNLPAGTYFCKIESNNHSSAAKFFIIK
jgi:hypothetical protein